MIVMKFGGSSIESAEAIRRVCGIIHSHLHRQPLVIVSAVGKTTDRLIEMAREASTGHGYAARTVLNEIQDLHFALASELLTLHRLESADQSFRRSFRELYGLIHDLCEEGRLLTGEVSDGIASFGERLSSELLAAAISEAGVPATQLDSRSFIVTDDHYGSATPLHWETYARLRRGIPEIASRSVVVLGGFIAATEDGKATTLGRGDSDLTASLVGAALNVEEIQIWTDVDGMLTCDPRVFAGAYRLRKISYDEALTMAGSGAKVLHPDSVKPAVRNRIPLVICNSRRPLVEGTRIEAATAPSPNFVKSIAVLQNLLLLAIRPLGVADDANMPGTLHDFLRRKGLGAALVKRTADYIYVGFENTSLAGGIKTELTGCVEGRVMTNFSVLTLVGAGVGGNRALIDRAAAALKGMDPIEFHGESGENSISFALPQRQCHRACGLLHREFFSEVDANLFAPASVESGATDRDRAWSADPLVTYAMRKTRILTRLHFGGHPTA